MMLTIAFLVSLILSLSLVSIVRKLSHRFGFVAAPRTDRWHNKPTPKLGGIGIFLAFLLAVAILNLLSPFDISHWPLLAGASLIFVLGLVDDIKQISPPAKLIGEIIAAAIIVIFGRNIDFFQAEFLNILLTFFWLVGITNAINLLDNMDGLASGVSFIAACLLSVLFWKSGSEDLMLISLALAGGILGFLVFNFPPASIFMGDSGSLFLGFTLSALAIARVPQASDLLAVMGVPTLFFLLPILDTSLVTITRILRGQSPTRGGRDHTSHRLIAFGLSERQAVLFLYGVAIVSGILGVVIESIDYDISLILTPILLVSLALLTAYLGRLKVILPDSDRKHQGGFTSLMIGLTYRGRVLEIALDLLLISITYYLAFWIHFGTQADIINLDIFLNSLPIALGCSYIAFFASGIYRGVWQYLDIRDMLRYTRAALGAVLLTAFAMSWIYYPLGISLRIFVIFAILLLLGLVVSRSSFTLLDRLYIRQIHDPLKESPILIYGAGDDGIMLMNWLSQDSHHRLNPIGFLDDDPFKHGRQILGLRVLGGLDDLESIIRKIEVKGILVSSENTIPREKFNDVLQQCRDFDIWLKKPRIEFDSFE